MGIAESIMAVDETGEKIGSMVAMSVKEEEEAPDPIFLFHGTIILCFVVLVK